MKRNKADEARVTDPADDTGRHASGLGAPIQSAIGRELRAMYDEVVNEPVPDRFAMLLRQLEEGQLDDATAQTGSKD